MPIIKSAKKQMRQDIKRHAKNAEIKSAIKSAWKKFVKNPTRELLGNVQSEFDKAVKKGFIKKNTAARRKALAAKIAKANAGVAKTADKVEKAVKTEVKAAKKVVAKTAKTVEKKATTTAKKVEKAVKAEVKAAPKAVKKATKPAAKK
ncbi:MAG: 30S ribosomal protein S20 [Candidatus Nomurabacteria bacterium]|jgi:small subunit ribosomal protein S20|nr:30S ribosomal protein S20 [Candidatus Nomurabacteria bacterium]